MTDFRIWGYELFFRNLIPKNSERNLWLFFVIAVTSIHFCEKKKVFQLQNIISSKRQTGFLREKIIFQLSRTKTTGSSFFRSFFFLFCIIFAIIFFYFAKKKFFVFCRVSLQIRQMSVFFNHFHCFADPLFLAVEVENLDHGRVPLWEHWEAYSFSSLFILDVAT